MDHDICMGIDVNPSNHGIRIKFLALPGEVGPELNIGVDLALELQKKLTYAIGLRARGEAVVGSLRS